MASVAVAEPTFTSRVIGMLFHPREEWEVVAAENSDSHEIFTRYSLPLIAAVPIGGLIGCLAFGPHLFGFPLHISGAQAVAGVAIGFVLMIVTYQAMVMISDSLAARLGSEATFTQSFKLVTYCCTPTWLLLAVAAMVPVLRFVVLGVVWTTWLAYIGAGPVMGLTGGRAARYVALLAAASAVLYPLALFLTVMQFNLLHGMGILN